MDKCIKSQSQWCISWCWDKTEAINQLPLMVKSAKSILYTSEVIKLVSWIRYSSRVYSYVYVYVCEGVHPYPLMHVHGGGGIWITQGWQPACVFLHFSWLCLFLLLLLFICLKQSLWLNLQLAASARQAGWLNCPWDLPVFSTQHQGYRHEPPHCLLQGYWVSNSGPDTCPASTLSAQQPEFTLKENKTNVFTKALVIYLIIILNRKPKRKAQFHYYSYRAFH